MIQVSEPVDSIIKAIGRQKIKSENYRRLLYTQTAEVKEGLLLYNLMTREMVLLQNEEIDAFKHIDISNKTVIYLIENYFFVPENFEDYRIYSQAEFLFRMIGDNDKNPPLHRFIIYPTMDCNARCFYCFELMSKRISMSEQTANDVVEFIAKKSTGPISLLWFGGEPLYNSKVIDIIIKGLSEKNIKYKSEMISNGYLFDSDSVKKAKDFWKLEKIQITLDGTEEVYNKCKAYIYKNVPSPFNRVLNNIELLLQQDIHVNIRLNMDMHNYDDLYVLTNMLCERFGTYKNCKVYIALLFENVGHKYAERTTDIRTVLWKRFDELANILKRCGLFRDAYIEMYRRSKHCMADSNYSTTILPDGHLGKCEHYTEDNYYGSIYSDEIDWQTIERFKEVREIDANCKSCALRPKCTPLKMCPIAEQYCDELEKELKIKYLKQQMENSFYLFMARCKETTPKIDEDADYLS